MTSAQESVENCSICQNSRNKNFIMTPNNYEQIFGYLGPSHKYHLNICDSITSREKDLHKYKKYLDVQKSISSEIFSPKNLESKEFTKEKYQKWTQPGLHLYNFNSKTRYEETDSDFEDLKYPEKKTKNKNKKSLCTPCPKPNKCPQPSCRKKKIEKKQSEVSIDSDMERKRLPYDYSAGLYNISKESIMVKPKTKRKSYRTDPEDIDTRHNMKKPSNCKNIKKAIKNKLPNIDSDFSVDSTKRQSRRIANRRASTSSTKMNVKTIVNQLFGSIESLKKKGKRNNCTFRGNDSEDFDPRIITRKCKGPKTKVPPSGLTNSDFSVNSRGCKPKKKVARKKTSTSSTEMNAKTQLKQCIFGSIESIKHYKKQKKREYTTDIEDEAFENQPFVCKKPTKAKPQSVKKKKKIVKSKCYICMEHKFNLGNKKHS